MTTSALRDQLEILIKAEFQKREKVVDGRTVIEIMAAMEDALCEIAIAAADEA